MDAVLDTSSTISQKISVKNITNEVKNRDTYGINDNQVVTFIFDSSEVDTLDLIVENIKKIQKV